MIKIVEIHNVGMVKFTTGAKRKAVSFILISILLGNVHFSLLFYKKTRKIQFKTLFHEVNFSLLPVLSGTSVRTSDFLLKCILNLTISPGHCYFFA